jgi:hypothetical protein
LSFLFLRQVELSTSSMINPFTFLAEIDRLFRG